MTTDILQPACPICARPGPVGIGELGHRQLARCGGCGHRFVARCCGEALRAEYRAAYYGDADDPRIAAWAAAHRPVWDAIVEQLAARQPSAASFLDVGSGSGGFLARLRVRHPGARLAAVESAASARAALAARMPDVSFVADRAEELELVAERFDVITMLQTLEHLAAPSLALRGALRCLNPGGLLFVTVPNRRSLAVLRRGWRADCFANGTHLQFFSQASLRAVLRRTGFESVRRVVHFGGGQYVGRWSRAVQYLVRWLGLATELRVVARPGGHGGRGPAACQATVGSRPEP